jgi:acetyl esterase
MPIDPKLRALLDSLPPAPPLDQVRPDQVRANIQKMVAGMEFPDLPQVRTRDVEIPGSAGAIPARVYLAGAAEPAPVIVHFHGGGWVVGSLETHDPFCRYLCGLTQAVIVSVDYRLAPEHKFPAAVEDAEAATLWVLEHAAELGGDAKRVFVSGDSAGGNLAAAVTLLLRGKATLRGQLLLFPATDGAPEEYASYQSNATGYGLEAVSMRWYIGQYLAREEQRSDPRFAPVRASDLSGLPPALVMTGEYDVLRDEGIRYAERLTEAGVAVTHIHYGQMHHNFPVWPLTVAALPQSFEARREIAEWVRQTAQ